MPDAIFIKQIGCHSELWLLPEEEEWYHITVTINPKLYSIGAAYRARDEVTEQILKYLMPSTVDYLAVVYEYTKKGMIHFHCLMNSPDVLSVEFRRGVIKGLERLYGLTQFNEVEDKLKYTLYLEKDLDLNFKREGFSHLNIYNR